MTNWKDEFNEKFTRKGIMSAVTPQGNDYFVGHPSDVKDFIESLLKKEREEVVGGIIGTMRESGRQMNEAGIEASAESLLNFAVILESTYLEN
jgi:hypothetical protein